MTVDHALRFSMGSSEQSRRLRVFAVAALDGGGQLKRAEWCLSRAAGDLNLAWTYAVVLLSMPQTVLDTVEWN